MSELEDELIKSKRAIFDLIEHNEMLDDDGYPTDAALDVIRLWYSTDAKGWFKFIEGLWYFHDWGWREEDEPHDWDKNKIVHRYYISTAGWSGNESIIRAMQQNENMLWQLNWLQSRRGGHHIFELREFNNE